MRTWGRVTAEDGTKTWVEIDTQASGSDDYVWVTTLIQCLLLNLGESPFYANYGIPAQPSVVTQVFPDFYVNQTQQQFAPHFASLSVRKISSPDPAYAIRAVLNNGTTFQATIPI